MDLVIQIIAGAIGGYAATILRAGGKTVSVFVGALGGALGANVLVALLSPRGPGRASVDLLIGSAVVAALVGFILARVIGFALLHVGPELRLGPRRRKSRRDF